MGAPPALRRRPRRETPPAPSYLAAWFIAGALTFTLLTVWYRGKRYFDVREAGVDVRHWLEAHTGQELLAITLILIPCSIGVYAISRFRKRGAGSQLAALRSLSWQDFENAVANLFRRQGYVVLVRGQHGADHGVDLLLTKGAVVEIAQCKQWRLNRVGASVVREQYGLLCHTRAARVKIVTSGGFTKPAELFARDKPIDLIDGQALAQLLAERGTIRRASAGDSATAPDLCPRCGSTLVQRKAGTSGRTFWGCSRYPACRGSLSTR